MERKEIEEINKWFKSKPNWFLYGANILLKKDSLNEDEINKICDICLDLVDIDAPIFNIETLLSVTSENSLSLISISDIKNVNQLAPKKPLEFSEKNMTIVYGTNGTGKSSYVRLLKNVCNARQKENIEFNIYTGDRSEQSAKISYRFNNTDCEYTWKKDQYSEDLKYCDIFDTKYSDIFLKNANTVSYEPPILLFFSKLVSMSEKISEKINSKIEKNISKLPIFPSNLQSTDEYKWLNKICYTTKKDEIENYCIFSNEDKSVLLELQNRLAETNQLEKAKKLQRKLDGLQNLIKYFDDCYDSLSKEKYSELQQYRNDYEQKRNTSKIAADKVFENSSLEGVGTDTWKALWLAAKKYSEEYAYKNETYPFLAVNQARCVLCHQELNDEATKRLSSFNDFVKGELEKQVQDSLEKVNIFIANLKEPKTKDEFELRITNYEEVMSDALKQQLIQINDNLLNTYNSFVNSKNYVRLREKKEVIAELNTLCNTLLSKITQLKNDYEKIDTETLTAKIHKYEAKKWLFDNKDSIISEIQRKKNIHFLTEKQKETNTKQISLEKARLSEKLITEEFVNRFREEIRKLDIDIDVSFEKESISKGHIYHRIVLKNIKTSASPEKILSEGEYRIVSIAAFLADMLGRNDCVPFIFDDPISSLDQNYEESVARRLIELSQTRQVIVFTHRLSFMCCLQDEAKHQESITPKIVSIKKEYWGAGEPSDLPINCDRPDKKLKDLINRDVPRIEKKLQENGQDEATYDIKALCSNFRIVIERTVEIYLICGVVERFRRAVQTMNKVKKLSNIQDEDCKLIDDLMTEYSKYEHSQTYEMPGKLPNIENIKEDMNKLSNWIDGYKKRMGIN